MKLNEDGRHDLSQTQADVMGGNGENGVGRKKYFTRWCSES